MAFDNFGVCMDYTAITEAVSDEQPCGPDLLASGDFEFDNATLLIEDLFPSRFLSEGKPFDRKAIKIEPHIETLHSLLERSRDLRLIALEARLQALCGTMEGYSACLQGAAALLSEQWYDAHPVIEDGFTVDRQNSLETFSDYASICMPLMHMPIVADGKIGNVSYRTYEVACGKKDARDGEYAPGDAPPATSAIVAAVQSHDNASKVEAFYAATVAAREAAGAIRRKCQLADSNPFSPDFDRLEGVLDGIRSFLEEARPDLAADEASAADQDDPAGTETADDTAHSPEASQITSVASGGPTAVGNVASHADAAAALDAVVAYFIKTEPSSPGLILVKQARLLIGKPLMAALEILLPGVADKAMIDFGSEHGFNMTVPRMKMLSEGASDNQITPSDPAAFVVENREQASATISNVETFYRQTEPSSPVPILLFKAKTYQSRDFSAIINDLFAHVSQDGGANT